MNAPTMALGASCAAECAGPFWRCGCLPPWNIRTEPGQCPGCHRFPVLVKLDKEVQP